MEVIGDPSWTSGSPRYENISVTTNWVVVLLIGIGVGFLAGMFGKGGSGIATPLLHLAGVPSLVAVAAPLPAAIPSTLVATVAYWRAHLVDRVLVGQSVAVGVPATVAGAYATRWISGGFIVGVTDVVIAALGLRLLLFHRRDRQAADRPSHCRLRLVMIAAVVGVLSGLLANSGGFLLAPLYLSVLRLPLKQSLATSLAVASVLAVPGTIVHWALGHINWSIVAVFATASIPLSYIGARVALLIPAGRLERLYGAALTLLGLGFIAARVI